MCEARDFVADSSCRVESSRVHAECKYSAKGLCSDIWALLYIQVGLYSSSRAGKVGVYVC